MGTHRGHLYFLLVIALLPLATEGVDKSNFKTCDQSSFCKRNRNLSRDKGRENTFYVVEEKTKRIDQKNTFIAYLRHSQRPAPTLQLTLSIYEFGIIRCWIEEIAPFRKKFTVSKYAPVIMNDTLKKLPIQMQDAKNMVIISPITSSNEFRLNGLRGGAKNQSERNSYSVEIDQSKFVLRYKVNGKIMAVANDAQLFNYEEYRTFSEQESFKASKLQYDATSYEDNAGSLWYDAFKGFNSSIPYGPSSVGLDFKFPESIQLYGLPEHASHFLLEPTGKNGDPYRLFHLDVYDYEPNSRMALYGTVPYVLSKDAESLTEVIWVNSAETWVDIHEEGNKTVHWFSEAGTIEFFLLSATTLDLLMAKFHLISGKPPLPLYAALGYHQSRYTYDNDYDVYSVDDGFDNNIIPYDSIWLDIDHTHGRRYFTWDKSKFPEPAALQKKFESKSRFVVAIVDPHILKDDQYHVYQRGMDPSEKKSHFFIRNEDNVEVYTGRCWPGTSAYLDFLNSEVRTYWRSLFSFENYPGSTSNLFIWNDMNEPCVFDTQELSLTKNCKHNTETGETFEHREVHNAYGFLNHMSTYEGLKERSPNVRPFVLTRSFYLGSQRYGAVWTGDNAASWEHLVASIPMLLSLSLGGISFAGADIGGYKGHPTNELITRWYQLGAFYPFFRGHSEVISPRREPWLFPSDVKDRIKKAIQLRYSLLPYLYTLFYEYATYSTPIIKPVWIKENSNIKNIFQLDKQFFFGNDIMIVPALALNQVEIKGYLPIQTTWYSFHSLKKVTTVGVVEEPANMDQIGVYARGGAIIPLFKRIRRSSVVMRLADPYTLYVFLDKSYTAEGYLYIDDGESWDYKNKDCFLLKKMTMVNRELNLSNLRSEYRANNLIERILVMGYDLEFSHIYVSSLGEGRKTVAYKKNEDNIEMVHLHLPIQGEYKITFE